MKVKSEMDEGPIAFELFQDALKKIISTPKVATTKKQKLKRKPRSRQKPILYHA